jgi:hypothetical protein
MIYITYRNCNISETFYVNNVWEVTCVDVEKTYLEFLLAQAEDMGITINPHWGNIMNHENHNSHLTSKEYREKEKEWKSMLRKWNIEYFIEHELKGRKVNFKEIHKF